MKTLVTGGAGFIGGHVTRLLVEAGREVRVLHLPGEDLRNIEGLDVERVAGDVTVPGDCTRAIAGCDVVYHLAAIYALWLPRPARMREVNVGGTRNLLRAAADAGVLRVVHTSTIGCFGGQGAGFDATEESPFALPMDAYTRTKREAHEVAVDFARAGLDVVIAAPCGPIGPGDVGPTPTGKLLLSIVNLPAAFLIDTESNMVDVRDVARGHLLAEARGKTGETYLLGNRNLSLRELATMAREIAGVRKPIVEVPAAVAEAAALPMLWYADRVSHRAPLLTPSAVAIGRLGLRANAAKAVRELGLPQTPIETAVRDALAWFAARGYIKDRAVRRRLGA